MDKLHLIQIFCAVVEAGSFAAAANNLSMSPSSISKAINRLENDLQCKLFHRSTRKLSLSEEGNVYFLTTAKIFEELNECESALKNRTQKASGELRLNLPVSYGRIYILPLIAKFLDRYPDISTHISFDDSYVDLVNGGYDLSIRTGTLADKNHYARTLSPMDFLICSSPSYYEKMQRDNPQKITLECLKEQPWIQFRFKQTGRVMPISIPYGSNIVSSIQSETCQFLPDRGIVVDDGEALAYLCSEDQGLTQIPHFIAKPWIESGDIISLTPIYRPKDSGVYITYSEKKLLPTRSRVFIDYICEEIEAIGETAHTTWAEKLPVLLSIEP